MFSNIFILHTTSGGSSVIETPMCKRAAEDYPSERHPLGRMGRPDEIAKAAAFLACDDSSYIRGIELDFTQPGHNTYLVD